MKHCFIVEYDESQVAMLADQCMDFIKDGSVITLTGSLGAGKTTFVSALLKRIGVTEPITSPTFTYVNTYRLLNGFQIYHFDLYRLDSLASFEMMGFNEYLYSPKSLCIIEWPEIITPLLQKGTYHITLNFLGIDKRKMECQIVQ